MSDPLNRARDTIEDAIIELRALQANTESKMHRDELETLINRLYSLELDIDEVIDP